MTREGLTRGAQSLLQTDPRYAGWSVPQVWRTIAAEEGLRGFYKGLTVTCVRAAPAHALIFLSFEWTEEFLAKY